MTSNSAGSGFDAPSVSSIVDALPAMIAYWRRDLICLHANESYLAWFGRARTQVLGHHIREVIGETPFRLNWPHICGVLNGEPQFFERQLTRADGQIAIATANYIPDFADDGIVRGFYVLVSDITHLRQTEQQLRDSELELRRLLSETREALAWQSLAEEVAHVGHWRIELETQSIFWSQEVFRIHDVTPETYSPTIQTALTFYHPDDRPRVSDLVAKAIETGQAFEFDARLVRHSGLIRTVRSRGMPMIDDLGKATSVFGVFIDITDQVETEFALRKANERLEGLVHHDALTGLANRRRFDTMLDHEWAAAAHAGTALSLLMIDVDCFKHFNDEYGHQAGDACLQAVAKAIGSVPWQSGGNAARYGGEEFAVLLPGADEHAAAGVAEQARAAVEALGMPHRGNPDGGGVVTASFGVATARPQEAGNIAALVRQADAHLYDAKRTGRNRVIDRGRFVERKADPAAEARRLATVETYAALAASRRDPKLDRLAATAAHLLHVPIGLVTLVTEDTQFLIGNFGLEEYASSPRDQSFCSHTIVYDEPMVVLDARIDPRFDDNALVNGEPGIRFYMGVPIVSERDGQKLGALCVIDREPHDSVDPMAREVLRELATVASNLIEEAASKRDHDAMTMN